jgi:hypothetical protein
MGLSSVIVWAFPAAAILGPIGIGLLGLGVGVFQADQARKELVKVAKKELVKYLPQVANEQGLTVQNAVKECFDVYEREVIKRVNDDIEARKAELDNLLKQKESYEINRDAEAQRLKKLEADISAESSKIESVYQNLLVYYS